jgi:hypothetical protein
MGLNRQKKEDIMYQNKMPKKLKIGWQTYEIQEVPELEEDGTPLYGVHSSSRNLIQISQKECDESRKRSCLIHEVLHAIDEQYCIRIKESQVEALANGITTVMIDNKDQIKQFLEWFYSNKQGGSAMACGTKKKKKGTKNGK